MIITVPDPKLEALLASTFLLARLWPAAVEDVKFFLVLLKLARPSLAEALSDGLVQVAEPVPGIVVPQITLGCGNVVLTGQASGQEGESVAEPHLRPADVWRLAVSDVAVSGRSALRLAAG